MPNVLPNMNTLRPIYYFKIPFYNGLDPKPFCVFYCTPVIKKISFLHHPRVITVVLTNFARKVKNTSVAMIEHKYVVNTIVHLYFSSSNHSYFQGGNISKMQL